MSSKKTKNIGASVKNKLLDISKELNTDFNYIVMHFAQERFLYRLSKSKYVDNFILKGALFLYSSSSKKFRQTKDIDFLGKEIINEENNLKDVIKEISDTKYNDGIFFQNSNVTSEKITEEKEYEGIRIGLPFNLDTIKSVITIDVGFGDVYYKKPKLMNYPTLLEMEYPKIYAYSIETVIAEKLEAIVKLNYQTSRMKDFYDILFIADNFNLKSKDLLISIKKTFLKRNTDINNRKIIYEDEFKNDTIKQKQWNGFLKRIKTDMSDDFNTVINKIESFIEPIFENPEDYISWNKLYRKWKK